MYSLYQAFQSIKTEEEFNVFLKDLCTPKEIKDMNERLLVASKLYGGQKSYREIHNECGVSLVTITRVARFLNHEPHHGYQLVLKRLKEKQ
jgi:TrpR-related protein YerC/YecD